MNTIKYDGKEYLELQSKRTAPIRPLKQILTGNGIDRSNRKNEFPIDHLVIPI